jgi:DNA-binding MarR family transcriptional regulator
MTRKAKDTDSHEQMLEVLRLFRTLFRSVRMHYGSVRRETGMNGAQLWALCHIDESPGCTPGDLARDMALNQSTVSNLVRKLVEQGLVTRTRNPDDQRIASLQPTAKGRRVMKRASKPLVGVLQHALSRLSRKDLQELQALLRRLTASMPGREADGPPISLL